MRRHPRAARPASSALVKLLGEASIGSGVRRVEALVGIDAYDFLAREHALVGQLTEALKVRPEELPERVAGILGRLKDAEREIDDDAPAAGARRRPARWSSSARDVVGVDASSATTPATASAPTTCATLALDLRGRLGNDRPSVVAVAGVAKGRPVVIVATNEPARRVGRQGR